VRIWERTFGVGCPGNHCSRLSLRLQSVERLALFTMPAVMEPSVLYWGRATEVMGDMVERPKISECAFPLTSGTERGD